MKRILKSLCLLLSVFCVITMMASCGNNMSYWAIEAKKVGDHRVEYVAELNFEGKPAITQVWVNLSNLKPEKTTLNFVFNRDGSEKKRDYDVNNSDIKASKDGWIKLKFEETEEFKANSVKIKAVDTMHFNEVVFVGKDNKLLKLTFKKGGIVINDKAGDGLYDEEGLKALKKEDPAYSEHPSFNIIDEQDKFPKEKLENK